ncbi:hypothetical protein Twillingate_009 [Staphylococcus phage Twillingate]|nr:hypothetical protein Twillingate_009 [Staphylococcus phage Twillingate]
MDIDIIGFKNYIKGHGRKSYVGYNTYYTITNDEYGVECVFDKEGGIVTISKGNYVEMFELHTLKGRNFKKKLTKFDTIYELIDFYDEKNKERLEKEEKEKIKLNKFFKGMK